MKPAVHTSDHSTHPETCAYCGAVLDENYYFCLSCATPYKSVESVLPPARPAPPTTGFLIAKKAPHVMPLFWTYVAVVVGTALFSFFVFGERQLELVLIFQTLAVFVTTCVFAKIHWSSLMVQFRRFGFLKKEAVLGLMALVPLLAVNYYIYHSWLVDGWGVKETLPILRLRDSGLGEPALILLFCVFPAVTEEIAFRGLVQHWLQIAVSPFYATALASLLFTALHFSVFSAPYIFVLGMVLGWVKRETNSLYPSMAMHFLHNLVVIDFFSH